MRASMSSVAVMPTGSGSPQMSPTSRPTLLGLLTPTPTNSNSGCLTISAITILPTKPVPQTTTRFEPRSDMPTFRSSAPGSRLHPKHGKFHLGTRFPRVWRGDKIGNHDQSSQRALDPVRGRHRVREHV